jgi:hypothetical protein
VRRVNPTDKRLVQLLVETVREGLDSPARRVVAVNDITWRAADQHLAPEDVLAQGEGMARDLFLSLARIGELSTNAVDLKVTYSTLTTELGKRWSQIRSRAFMEVSR